MTNFKLGELVQIAEQEGIFVYMGILTEWNKFEKAQDIHNLYQCTKIYNKLVQCYQDSFNSLHNMESLEEIENFKMRLFCVIEANVWYASGRHVLTEIERNQHYIKCTNIKYLL